MPIPNEDAMRSSFDYQTTRHDSASPYYDGDNERDYDDYEDDSYGCLFPGRCVCPSLYHRIAECATADMMMRAVYERDERQMELPL